MNKIGQSTWIEFKLIDQHLYYQLTTMRDGEPVGIQPMMLTMQPIDWFEVKDCGGFHVLVEYGDVLGGIMRSTGKLGDSEILWDDEIIYSMN